MRRQPVRWSRRVGAGRLPVTGVAHGICGAGWARMLAAICRRRCRPISAAFTRKMVMATPQRAGAAFRCTYRSRIQHALSVYRRQAMTPEFAVPTMPGEKPGDPGHRAWLEE